MLRTEIFSISVTRDEGVLGLHVTAKDDHGVPRHSDFTAADKHGVGLLMARSLKRWLENRWAG